MLYTEEDFQTPETWLNNIDITELPHHNIQKDKIEVSASCTLPKSFPLGEG